MNADSHFEIGKDHLICEDYSLSGKTGKAGELSYAIVADGCSSSPNVDLGARVLAHSALQTITFPLEAEGYHKFGEEVVRNAGKIFGVLPFLHPQALDATLMAAFIDTNILTAYMYGDGVIYVKFANGDARAIHVSFPTGAPSYLSYLLEKGRMDNYLKLSPTKVVKDILFRGGLITSCEEKEVPSLSPVMIEGCALTEGDVVCLSSDGINSFRKGDGELIPWTDLLGEFFEYKNTTGVFVTRRLAAFQRKCQKEQITHFDDISVASIIV